MSPRLQRTTIWLCSIAALWLGVVPAQGLVMCLEPSGAVSISVAVDGHCAGCSTECDAAAAATPTEAHGHDCCGAKTGEPGVGGVALAAGTCPCVDVALSHHGDDSIQPGTLQPLVVDLVSHRPVVDAPRPPPPLDGPPAWVTASNRPPPTLALRRSVVLLI